MPNLLLELFSEEIPARMQKDAAENLRRLMLDRLKDGGCAPSDSNVFWTPRRLTLELCGLPEKQPDISDERKGPKVDAPEKAIQGFLRSVGKSIDELEKRSDKKGQFYVARIEQKGRPLPEIFAEIVPEIVRAFPWPKSMRWGSGDLRWVRPLHSILCLFDDEVVEFEVDDIKSGRKTYGHRFLAPEAITIGKSEDYAQKLEEAFVICDASKRRALIEKAARSEVEKLGYDLVDPNKLLDENAGLVEWPVVMVGEMDAGLVAPVEQGGLPPEVLTTTVATHQKYFCVCDTEDASRLAPYFVLVSNMTSTDGGDAIRKGNERVLRARLSDASFFWDQDRKTRLEDRVDALKEIVFHAELGSVYDKTQRIEKLATSIANAIGADADKAARAARLAKADLTSDVVYEMPEVQGTMGRYYARNDNEDAEVAEAIHDHYSPVGPHDSCPTAPVSVAVALADKIDTLVNFFGIGQKPTGSKDPFALRRAALGVIRLILENRLRLKLTTVFNEVRTDWPGLMEFFGDRLKVQQRDLGVRHDLIDAVFALPGQDDLVLIVDRVAALSEFLSTEVGENLLTGYKRAANILRIEEKKDKQSYEGEPDSSLFRADEEQALWHAIEHAETEIKKALAAEDFNAAMSAASKLRGPVDSFFENVTVNDNDPTVRANRLRLLSGIRYALDLIADFSKTEG